MDNKKPTDYSELPLVLTVEDVMRVLSIGRNVAYEIVRSGTIRSVKIGRSYRIPRDAVIEFLMGASYTQKRSEGVSFLRVSNR